MGRSRSMTPQLRAQRRGTSPTDWTVMSERNAETADREAGNGSAASEDENLVDRAKESGATEAVDESNPIVLLAGASVLFSWYQYHIRGNKHYGLFTGLWAPTLLAFASYIQDADLTEAVEEIRG